MPLCNKRFKIKYLIKNNINRNLSQHKLKNKENKIGTKNVIISSCRTNLNDNNSELLSPNKSSKILYHLRKD